MKRSTLLQLCIVGALLWGAVLCNMARAAAPTPAEVRHAVAPAFRHRTAYVPLAVLALAAVADILTTRAAINRGCHETNPIYGPHPSDGAMIATHALVVGVAWRTKAPAWADYVGAGLLGAAALHNASTRCR